MRKEMRFKLCDREEEDSLVRKEKFDYKISN